MRNSIDFIKSINVSKWLSIKYQDLLKFTKVYLSSMIQNRKYKHKLSSLYYITLLSKNLN